MEKTLGKRTIDRLINSFDYFREMIDNPKKFKNFTYTSSFIILGLTGYKVFKGDYNDYDTIWIGLGIPALMSFVGYERYEYCKRMEKEKNIKRERERECL